MFPGLRMAALSGGLVALLLADGCREPAPADLPGVAPVGLTWQPVALPGGDDRLMLRDVATCAGRWYLVGGAAATDGTERPLAWRSVDGRHWEPLVVRAASFYGRQSVLYAAACRDGRLAGLGSRVGGVHGNPRVAGWRQAADGSLVEVPAGAELYGGPNAAGVTRMTAGPAGWLTVGNRISGAAVWVATDPARFEIVESARELASDAAGRTWVFDATASPGGWLAVGGVGRSGRVERDSVAWASPDGRTWRRQEVPAAAGYDELQRVTTVADRPVAVGPRGPAFGAWRDDGAGWSAAGEFDSTQGGGVATVSDLVALDGRLYVAVSDGTAHRLWASDDRGDSWRPVLAPTPVLPAGAGRMVTLGAQDHRLLVVVDDGAGVAIWSAVSPA
ncbi:hypothetical protein [Plantactinospora sp. WMMB782]|uniref:hypothetical protein n=1 Tax=Plantactinospora sp. WMMB782 TaxID=3404121 RepID=UPI003B946114